VKPRGKQNEVTRTLKGFNKKKKRMKAKSKKGNSTAEIQVALLLESRSYKKIHNSPLSII
jgi:hypothetical protein